MRPMSWQASVTALIRTGRLTDHQYVRPRCEPGVEDEEFGQDSGWVGAGRRTRRASTDWRLSCMTGLDRFLAQPRQNATLSRLTRLRAELAAGQLRGGSVPRRRFAQPATTGCCSPQPHDRPFVVCRDVRGAHESAEALAPARVLVHPDRQQGAAAQVAGPGERLTGLPFGRKRLACQDLLRSCRS